MKAKTTALRIARIEGVLERTAPFWGLIIVLALLVGLA